MMILSSLLFFHLATAAVLAVILLRSLYSLAQTNDCPFLSGAQQKIALSTTTVMGSGLLLSLASTANWQTTCAKFGGYLTITTVVYALIWLKQRQLKVAPTQVVTANYLLSGNWAVLSALVLALAV